MSKKLRHFKKDPFSKFAEEILLLGRLLRMQMGCVETEVQLSQVEEWMRLRWLEMAVDEIIAKWRIEARATSEPVNKVVVDECHKQVGLSSGFLHTPGKISSILHVGLDPNSSL